MRPERLLQGLRPLGLADARLAVRCAPATAIAAARRWRRTPLFVCREFELTHPMSGVCKHFLGTEVTGAPGEIRTPDLLVRSQALYPTELRAQCKKTLRDDGAPALQRALAKAGANLNTGGTSRHCWRTGPPRLQTVDCGGRMTSRTWRRGRDSNPRWAFDPYALSRGAPSTTRPPLQRIHARSRTRRMIPVQVSCGKAGMETRGARRRGYSWLVTLAGVCAVCGSPSSSRLIRS